MDKLNSIQIGRGIAALMVLVFHLMFVEQKYTPFDLLSGWAEYGKYGVDVFFVISGFIMAYTTRNLPSSAAESFRFLLRRAVRIYPLYWVFTTIVLAIAFVRPDVVNSSFTSQPDLLKSYLLLPQGGQPLLAVGWTLVYEMYFYAVFALVLLLPRHLHVPALVFWAVFTLLLDARGYAGNPYLSMAASPMCLEFMAGAFIGMMPFRFADGVRQSILTRMGDASYATYLSHVLVISALGRFWGIFGNESLALHVVWLVATTMSALAAGLVTHRLVEVPLNKYIRNLVTADKKTTPAYEY